MSVSIGQFLIRNEIDCTFMQFVTIQDISK
jgi:hypothetical protein